MAWWDDLNAGQSIGPRPGSIEELRARLAAQESQKPKQPQQSKHNFFTDALPTIGGIGGGILGSLVAPIAGTAAGSGIGSALGQGLENALTGDSLDKNVLQEGALGAVFGAGPLKLLRGGVSAIAGKTAGSALENAAAKGAGNAVAQGADNAGRTVLKTSFTGKLNRMGDKALASQYGTIGKNVARSNNPVETISQLADLGITKPVDAERIANGITGSRGILTKTVASALDGTTPISTYGIKGVMRNAITSNGLVDKDAKSVVNIINSQLKVLKDKGNSPSVVLKVMQNLEKRAANLQGKGGNYRLATPERVDQANALLSVRNELQDRIYKQGGGNTNLSNVLTPKLRQSLIDLHPGNKQWEKYVDQNVMGVNDIGKLRSAQAPFVRIKNIIDEGNNNSLTFGGRAGNHTLTGGTVANTVINTMADNLKNPAARIMAGPLRNAGKLSSTPITQSKKGIATRLGLLGAVNELGSANQNQSIGPNTLDNNTTMNDSTNNPASMPNTTNIGQSYQNNGEMSSPYSKANLLFDIQRDPANADQYIQYYQALQDVFNPSTGADLSQSSKNALASSDNAINTIDQLQQLYGNAGGGSGRLGGFIQGIAGDAGFDQNARIYNNLSQASVTQIAKALAGAGSGTVSDMDAKVIIAALPTLTDTPEEAKAKFAALRQRLENARNNTMLYGAGTGGSLEDALMQAGGGGY